MSDPRDNQEARPIGAAALAAQALALRLAPPAELGAMVARRAHPLVLGSFSHDLAHRLSGPAERDNLAESIVERFVTLEDGPADGDLPLSPFGMPQREAAGARWATSSAHPSEPQASAHPSEGAERASVTPASAASAHPSEPQASAHPSEPQASAHPSEGAERASAHPSERSERSLERAPPPYIELPPLRTAVMRATALRRPAGPDPLARMGLAQADDAAVPQWSEGSPRLARAGADYVSRQESFPAREASLPARESSFPAREASFPVRDSILPPRESSLPPQEEDHAPARTAAARFVAPAPPELPLRTLHDVPHSSAEQERRGSAGGAAPAGDVASAPARSEATPVAVAGSVASSAVAADAPGATPPATAPLARATALPPASGSADPASAMPLQTSPPPRAARPPLSAAERGLGGEVLYGHGPLARTAALSPAVQASPALPLRRTAVAAPGAEAPARLPVAATPPTGTGASGIARAAAIWAGGAPTAHPTQAAPWPAAQSAPWPDAPGSRLDERPGVRRAEAAPWSGDDDELELATWRAPAGDQGGEDGPPAPWFAPEGGAPLRLPGVPSGGLPVARSLAEPWRAGSQRSPARPGSPTPLPLAARRSPAPEPQADDGPFPRWPGAAEGGYSATPPPQLTVAQRVLNDEVAPPPDRGPSGAQPAATSGQTPAQSIEQLAQQIYDHLRRRLLIDVERQGRSF